MSGFAYASALGRLKPQFSSFLGKEFYATLTAAKDLNEITKLLEGTAYGPEIAQSASQYRGAPLLEVAINRSFVRRNRQAFESAPFAGRPVVGAYLRRWDTQNIGLILSSKALGRTVSDAELFLVSSREIPAGLFAGSMTIDDFRLLLQQPSLDAVAQGLVRFGYGGVLLPLMESYSRTHDIFPLLLALDRDYYTRLLETSRFFQGDEWTVRLLVQSEIDLRNALLLLKGKDGNLPVDVVQERFLPGGLMPASVVPELYSARAVPELVQGLESRFPTLAQGNALYASDRSLTAYEAELLRDRAVRELKRLRSYPLSLSVIFTYLLLAELERTDLRRIIYGKVYQVDPNQLSGLLVVPRL
ncbi:MAG: V-type ATPase subunit [Thermoplasmata archaeon]|nr:V-type ATPase subunit [Thermoplasmata archaeon]